MKKIFKAIFISGAALTWIALIAWFGIGDSFQRYADEKQAEVIGSLADRYIAGQSAQANPDSNVKTVADLHHIEIKVDQYQDNIFRASGVSNSFLIKTEQGNVLFDTGLVTQGARHKRLLQEAATGKISHIILSHSHADHIGATKFWKAEFPNAKIITHRRFADSQHYLSDLEQHFWNRNRLLYTFMPESPPEDGSLFSYGGIKADIEIADRDEYRFTLGGVTFVVIAAPGAEGDDNIVLWLPQQKTLFSGDFFGPLFPMLPNLFTLRGEKFRDPLGYIKSLNRLIELKPEIIFPSHFEPKKGTESLGRDMTLMRDATQYIHDETINGMNAGKSVWQLMQDIQLPEHLTLSQGHGKVSWNVRSIWEYYSTWFKFESTTELYPVPVRTLYPELAILAGGAAALSQQAQVKLKQKQPEQALHLVEIALAETANYRPALQVRLQALQSMLDRAWKTGSNFSETGWLQSRIKVTQSQLEQGRQKEPKIEQRQ